MNSVYYIDIGEYLNGSIKSETLQNVFQVNKEELELQTKDMLYNIQTDKETPVEQETMFC